MPTLNPSWREFFLRWAVHSVGVLVATQVVPGLECRSWPGLFAASLLLGLLNAFVKPLLTLLSLPLVVLSLGLFLWVINAGLLYLVGWLVKPFVVSGFWSAMGGAAIISAISALSSLVRSPNRSLPPPRPPPHHRPGGPSDPGGGPIIDV